LGHELGQVLRGHNSWFDCEFGQLRRDLRLFQSIVEEFVAYLKLNPGKLTCGAVLGIAPHVMVEDFKVTTGTECAVRSRLGAVIKP
jgi:hypothetical protein